jgi:glutamyl/glutaminyl-tRNA synthetase
MVSTSIKQDPDKVYQSGDAYRCFCTHTELDQTRKRLQDSGSKMTYDRTCLKMTDEEVARRIRAGEKHTVRVNVRFDHPPNIRHHLLNPYKGYEFSATIFFLGLDIW